MKVLNSANLLLLILLSFCCCSKTVDDSLDTPHQLYSIQIGIAGDAATEVTYEPLTRTVNTDLYGIQVYYRQESGSYQPYAYGLFDQVSNLTLQLESGYSYKIVATMVKDGSQTVEHSTAGYLDPFDLQGTAQPVSNRFTKSTGDVMANVGQGSVGLGTRFYGEVSDYSPSPNGSVSLSLKRVSFGVRFESTDYTTGYFTMALDNADPVSVSLNEDYAFTLKGAYSEVGNNTSQTLNGKINWYQDANADPVLIADQNFTFYRNKITTMTVVQQTPEIPTTVNSVSNGYLIVVP